MSTPSQYHKAAYLARLTASEMLARLNLMTIQPRQVLDLGCGVGASLPDLSQRFPEAQVYGLDLAEDFLRYGKRQVLQGLSSQKTALIASDAASLPFSSHSVDLIFANLLIPWCSHPKTVLREWRRVLRPEGLLFFSCLGPDTFKEWREVEGVDFLPSLVDMHVVGDALLEGGFIDPVLEVDELCLTYASQEKIAEEMQNSGLMANALPLSLPLATTFEIVYAHAWCPAVKGFKTNEQGEVRIPVSQLQVSARGAG